jgi:hypothetical protein
MYLGISVGVWGAALPAYGQSNLDAGKSAAQIFSTTCVNCHRSTREIRRTTASFMRQHYTTGGQEAAAMAAYLAGLDSDPKAIEQRRKPSMGANQVAPAETAAKPKDGAPSGEAAKPSGEAAKPSETQAALNPRQSSEPAKPAQSAGAKARRPAESMEAGVPVAAVAAPAAEPSTTPAASSAPPASAPPAAVAAPIESEE